MGFTDQPNEMLDMLLNTPTIPLPQRLRLRAVSRRWLPVLEDGLARENTLVIRDKKAYSLGYKPDYLVLPGGILTEEFSRTLVRLFPSPTDLTLSFGWCEYPFASWNTVPTLLAQLGTNLTTVKLYGRIEKEVAEPLSRALTGLSSLTSLTLNGNEISIPLLPHIGPVLSRLEAFVCLSWISPESASIISSSLSPRCTRLLIDQDFVATLPGPFLAQLSASLTSLHLVDCEDPEDMGFLSQMQALTSLTLCFDYQLYMENLDSSFFRHLDPFARLTDLKLFGLNYQTSLPLPSKKKKKKTPWPTVQRLTLQAQSFIEDEDNETWIWVDYEAFFAAISTWFPALTKLTLIGMHPTDSEIQASRGKHPFSVEADLWASVDTSTPDW